MPHCLSRKCCVSRPNLEVLCFTKSCLESRLTVCHAGGKISQPAPAVLRSSLRRHELPACSRPSQNCRSVGDRPLLRWQVRWMKTAKFPQASSASRVVAAAAAAPNVARLPACTHRSEISHMSARVCRRRAQACFVQHSPHASTLLQNLLNAVRRHRSRALDQGSEPASRNERYGSLTVRGADWGAGVGAAVGAAVGVDAVPPAKSQPPLSGRWRLPDSCGACLPRGGDCCLERCCLQTSLRLRMAADCSRQPAAPQLPQSVTAEMQRQCLAVGTVKVATASG